MPSLWPVRFALILALGVCLAGCEERAPISPAVDVQPHSATVTWNPSVSPVSGYRVYRAASETAQPVALAVTPADTTQYTDTSVEPGKTYFYTVTSFDSANRESVFSEKVSATIPAP
jgi:fibronectin type 3 domain-containing protein